GLPRPAARSAAGSGRLGRGAGPEPVLRGAAGPRPEDPARSHRPAAGGDRRERRRAPPAAEPPRLGRRAGHGTGPALPPAPARGPPPPRPPPWTWDGPRPPAGTVDRLRCGSITS